MLIISFFACSLFAQVSIDPEVIIMESGGWDVIDVKYTITNNTDEFTELYWMFEKGEDFPPEWGVILCDSRTCYAENRFKTSPNLPNLLEPDSSFIYKVTIKAYGTAGSSYGILHMYSDGECTNEIATSKVPPVSVDEEVNEGISIYPNPVSDHFLIQNDEEVAMVEVYNNIGKLIERIPHKPGQSIATNNYNSQWLLINLIDSENKILKTERLLITP